MAQLKFEEMPDGQIQIREEEEQAIPETPERIRAEVEAVLFTMGESVPIETIAKALGMTNNQTLEILLEMQLEYEAEDRGIRLIRLDDRFQFATKKELYPILIKVAKQPTKVVLTDVMLETLSIIAYKQPVTRIEIEKIRGVKCDHAVNRLVECGLIEEVGRLDAPGRPILFGTTEEFLRHFGTDSVDGLPAINPVKVEDFKAEAEEEADVKLGV